MGPDDIKASEKNERRKTRRDTEQEPIKREEPFSVVKMAVRSHQAAHTKDRAEKS